MGQKKACIWCCIIIAVQPHELRPPRQNFDTNFEIGEPQVEI